jgi:isoquinoline 1-oxidoreductase subunit beta
MNTMIEGPSTSRRHFLMTGVAVAGGFALGLPRVVEAVSLQTQASGAPMAAGSAVRGGAWPLTDWVRITSDDVVTLVVSQAEMGQGISTTLPAVLADELGADWARIRLELAPTAAPYQNPRIHWQFTGNSESTQAFFEHLRQMGAAARSMLLTAGSSRLGVPAGELVAEANRVIHKSSGRSLSFGELAEDAGKLPVPEAPTLRADAQLKLIGRALPRVDQVAKADGSAQFGIDYIPEGLSGVLFAAIRTAPAYGAKPVGVKNLADIKQRNGVVDVVILATSVAVVAQRYWQARAALSVADIEFDSGPNAMLNSASLRQQYTDRLSDGPFEVAREVVPERAPPVAGTFAATYELGFQAHATLEPMNALAHVSADSAEVWAPTQGQDQARYTLAAALGIKPENVRVNRSPFLGGGFGRRLLPDFVLDAAQLSRAVGRPVKVIWSREEDMRRDHFRPATMHRLQAQVDATGRVVDIAQRLVSPTILKPVFPALDLSKGIDPSALEGTLHTRYKVPGWRTEFHLLDTPVPTSVYRTTGYGPAIFGLESFIDELAHRAKVDPLTYRRRLLAHDARAVRVLDQLAERSGWAGKLANAGHGRGRGVAFTDAFGTVLGQVIEVTVSGRQVKVDRIVTVADPGRVLDPRITEAGLEGGAIWALSSATKGEVTFDKGGPVQTNFHEYDMVRLRETPRFETHLLESPGEAIGGVGEVGPVATVPALANAIFAATGRRLRTFPLARSGLSLI